MSARPCVTLLITQTALNELYKTRVVFVCVCVFSSSSLFFFKEILYTSSTPSASQLLYHNQKAFILLLFFQIKYIHDANPMPLNWQRSAVAVPVLNCYCCVCIDGGVACACPNRSFSQLKSAYIVRTHARTHTHHMRM